MSVRGMPADRPGDDVIGLVVALPAEARSVGAHGMHQGTCARWAQGWVAVSGVGHDNALRATERLLAHGVTRLANWGVAGALDASLAPGDVMIPERILYSADDRQGFSTDPQGCTRLREQLSASLEVHRGALWSAGQPVATRAGKHAIAERTGAVAVDMEAAAVAAVAARAHLPFVAVKAICDPFERELPERIVHALGVEGGFSLDMLSAIAFGGPATWRAARELARDFARARQALAAASRLAVAA
jgi:nucleoside phosphorylase